jgi:hypothetical protein
VITSGEIQASTDLGHSLLLIYQSAVVIDPHIRWPLACARCDQLHWRIDRIAVCGGINDDARPRTSAENEQQSNYFRVQ